MPRIVKNRVNYAGNIYDSQPVGEVIQMAGDKNPAGYLPCDGRSVLRSDYPELFKKIGTKYGAEDDEHFNLPTEDDVDTVSTNKLNGALANYATKSDLKEVFGIEITNKAELFDYIRNHPKRIMFFFIDYTDSVIPTAGELLYIGGRDPNVGHGIFYSTYELNPIQIRFSNISGNAYFR